MREEVRPEKEEERAALGSPEPPLGATLGVVLLNDAAPLVLAFALLAAAVVVVLVVVASHSVIAA